MKPLVYFPRDTFETMYQTARLRKNIKGAFESLNIHYDTKFNKDIDVAIFGTLRAKDKKIMRKCRFIGAKTVYFALYQESDTIGKLLKRDKNGEIYIKQIDVEALNKVDQIFVPSIEAKKLLISLGVGANIDVIDTMVNMSRFANTSEREQELFKRYFHIRDGEGINLGSGNIKNKDSIKFFKVLASRFPGEKFYYFIDSKARIGDKLKIRRIARKAPKNLIIRPLVSDDLFRSGLMSASFYIEPSEEYVGTMTLFDVLASQTALVINERAVLSDVLPGDIASTFRTLDDIVKLVEDGKESQEKHCKNAINFAKTHSIENFAKDLMRFLESK